MKTTVVIAAGYPGDYGKLPWTQAWIARIEAAGMRGIAYSSQDPAAGFLDALRSVDGGRIAVLACSGNVPVALQALTRKSPVRIACAAFLYGYMLDAGEAATEFRFANPGVTIDDIDWAIPVFLARAGRDEMPRLNERLDSFVHEALARNMPLTLVNYPNAAHAFDASGDSEDARDVADRVLRFFNR